jgi:hypothetical protein
MSRAFSAAGGGAGGGGWGVGVEFEEHPAPIEATRAKVTRAADHHGRRWSQAADAIIAGPAEAGSAGRRSRVPARFLRVRGLV